MTATYRRYTDVPGETAPQKDFIVRERKPSLSTILVAFVGTFAAIVSAMMFAERIGGTYVFALLTFLLLCLICWFVIHVTQQNRDLVLVTEFQNALFSAVANMNSLFLLIAKANGTVHYYSSEYQKVFAGARKNGLSSLDSLLDSDGISKEDAQKIRTAMDENRHEMIFAKITDMEGNVHDVRLVVRPIARPMGYFLISCSAMRRRMSDQQAQPQAQDSYKPAHDLPAAMQDALMVAPLGICAFDVSGMPVFVHPDIERWLGYGAGDIKQQKLMLSELLYSPGDTPTIFTMQPFDGELIFKKQSGSLSKAFVVQRPYKDAHGNIAGSCAIIAPADRPNPFRHASGSLNVESKSSQSTADSYAHDLLDNAPVGIALLNKEGRIVRYNSMFASLTECAADGEVTLPDLMAPDSRDDIGARVREALLSNTSGTNQQISVQLPRVKKTASLFLSRLPSSIDGEFALVAHLIDTTEQKNLEEKYAHSQKMQAVGQLAGGIAHDFNNLLTAMIGFCDLLLMRHPAGDQSFADIMQIKQNANRAANLVRQLLAFSRRQTLQPKILDVTDVLAELSDLIRRLIGENIELNMMHGRDLGMIRVDQGQLEQVIINLAVNARDAMNGGGTLTIRTRNVSVGAHAPMNADFIQPADDDPIIDGEYVVVEVVDTGHGIPPEIITKIFEPFFSTKAIGSGTGLGLATVYGIIKQTGGYIFVSSKKDQGTVFALYLKRHAVDKTQAVEVDAENVPAVAADLTGKNTILLVEDEAPVRIFSARALRNKGYTVLEADCAEAGLEIIREQGKDIEIIVTDVIMPGKDGPSMIKEIWQQHPDIEVVFISGYAEDALVKMEGSEHEYSFLPKPFTLKQLAEKVKEVADKKK